MIQPPEIEPSTADKIGGFFDSILKDASELGSKVVDKTVKHPSMIKFGS